MTCDGKTQLSSCSTAMTAASSSAQSLAGSAVQCKQFITPPIHWH